MTQPTPGCRVTLSGTLPLMNKGIYGWGLGAEDWQTVYNLGNSGLPSNYVFCLAFDAPGNIWIGTYGGGLGKSDGVNWTVYNTANSGLPDDLIVALAIGEQGNIWIGTAGRGLAVYREGGVILTGVQE